MLNSFFSTKNPTTKQATLFCFGLADLGKVYPYQLLKLHAWQQFCGIFFSSSSSGDKQCILVVFYTSKWYVLLLSIYLQDFSPDTDKTLNVVDEKANQQQQAKPFQSILFAWLTKCTHTHTRESESEGAQKK